MGRFRELALGVDKAEEVLCSLRGDGWFGWDGLRRLVSVGWLVGWHGRMWEHLRVLRSVICHHG